jgi:hypothetical protein
LVWAGLWRAFLLYAIGLAEVEAKGMKVLRAVVRSNEKWESLE